MVNFLIRHPAILARLYIATKTLHLSFAHKILDDILEERRKEGFVLIKNISGRTLKKGEFVISADVKLVR